MPPKPDDPNQLRQSVAPNTLRGFDAPAGSWLANGTTDGARKRQGAPPAPRARGRQRPGISPRLVGRIGLLFAVAGVLPFLNSEFRWQQVGLGMMCGGVGMALLAASPGSLRSKAATGRPRLSMLGVPLGALQRAAVPALGGALLLLGLFLLVDAAIGW